MKSIIFSSDNNYPSATATQFASMCTSMTSGWSSTVASRNTTITAAGTLANLYVELDTAPASGKSWAFTVMKNGVATGLTVTIANTATTATDAVNSVTFAAGDTIAFQSVPTTTPTLGTAMYWNAEFTSTSTGQSNIMSINAASPSTTATNFMPVSGGMNSSSAYQATEARAAIIVPTGGTLSNFYVITGTAPGATKSVAVTLMKNGIAAALTATISNTNTTANDLTNSVTVAAGDTISWQIVPTGTPTTGIMSMGMRFTATNDGETFFGLTGPASLSTTVVQFEQPLGIGNNGWNATENLRYLVVGVQTIKKMYAALATAPGGVASRTLTLRQNVADTAMTVALSGATVSGNVAVDIVCAQGDKLALEQTPSGTPAASAGSQFGFLGYIAPPAAAPVAHHWTFLQAVNRASTY